MKVGKIEFGHYCTEPMRIKGRKHNIDGTVTDTLFAELDDKPDYVIPQFSDRCNKLMKELDTTQSKILSQPYKKDKSCANPYPQKPEVEQGSGSYNEKYAHQLTDIAKVYAGKIGSGKKPMSQEELDEECKQYGNLFDQQYVLNTRARFESDESATKLEKENHDSMSDNLRHTEQDKKDKPCANPYPQKQDALSKQVGGSHYKQYKIQPFEFFLANQIPHHKATVIRRIMRYDHPTGKGLEDLKKIKHEIDLIIQLENWEGDGGEPTAEKKG